MEEDGPLGSEIGEGKPMTLDDLLKDGRKRIREIAEKHGAYNVWVFGSFARGEASADSDVDLLVETGSRTSAWFPAGLILDLQELLGRPVDVVTRTGLNPDLRESVLNEALPL